MINFFVEDIHFDHHPFTIHVPAWLEQVASQESHQIKDLNFIFCSDRYLLDINQQYLQHDYFTDIISFDNSEEAGLIQGDIFISIERVEENAIQYQVPFQDEFLRVLAHGTLHLIGYDDTSEELQALMREKENFYLSLYSQSFHSL